MSVRDAAFLKQIGARIQRARKKAGMTQETLALKTDKPQNLISRYENGLQAIRLTDLPRVAEALDVPVTYFFEDEPAANLEIQQITRELRRLLPPFQSVVLLFTKRTIQQQEEMLSFLADLGISPDDDVLRHSQELVNSSADIALQAMNAEEIQKLDLIKQLLEYWQMNEDDTAEDE